jgi:hypothetical protein
MRTVAWWAAPEQAAKPHICIRPPFPLHKAPVLYRPGKLTFWEVTEKEIGWETGSAELARSGPVYSCNSHAWE